MVQETRESNADFPHRISRSQGGTEMTTSNKRSIRSEHCRLLHIDGMSLNSRYTLRQQRYREMQDHGLVRSTHRDSK
jgi:hypothetical protein